MHEYEELYKRWKKYRFKKTFKRYFLLSIFILLLGLYFYTNRQEEKKEVPHFEPHFETSKSNIILPIKDFEKHLQALHSERKKEQDRKQSEKSLRITQFKPAIKRKGELIQKEEVSLKELEDLFQSAPTASKALVIAKRYYRQKKYTKAATWALKANQLDKSNEESWLLFAKALAKLGKREQALNLLGIYYKKTHSPKAYMLLKQIKERSFQ